MNCLKIHSIVALALVCAAFGPTRSAFADLSQIHDKPAVVVCYQKVDAYGGVYTMTNSLVNNSDGNQTGSTEVWRGAEQIGGDSLPAQVGEWITGETMNLSIVLNDEFVFKLDGNPILEIHAQDVPFQLSHCAVQYTGISVVDEALRWGLSHLDAPYVGADGNARDGGPGDGQWHQGEGQNSYLSPLGVAGFDCSGLVVAMYRHAGLTTFGDEQIWPGFGSSTAMFNNFPQIEKEDLRPGDLIVKKGHVAVFVGDGDGDGISTVLEATPTGEQYEDGRVKGVVLNDASKYFEADELKPDYGLRRFPGVP